MSWRNVKLILLREVRDQLRDRRTLFMIAVLPLLLYPGLGIGLVQMRVLFSEQPRTVVVLGAADLPKGAGQKLLDGDRFVRNWFNPTSDAEKLEVVTDLDAPAAEGSAAAPEAAPATGSPPADGDAPPHTRAASDGSGGEPAGRTPQQKAELLDAARSIRRKMEERHRLEAELQELVEKKNASAKPETDAAGVEKIRRSAVELENVQKDLSRLFASSRIQVLIVVPHGFSRRHDELTARIARRDVGLAGASPPPGPQVVQSSADEKSKIAYARVKAAMTQWEESLLRQRLAAADLPASIVRPVNPEPVDLAKPEQVAANLWSKMFPALLVIMSVTGAFYPAVDVAAGEKERGTMETLLICPASRTEIVVGKFFTVMLFSMSTALLNLASMGFTGRYMVSLAGSGALARIGDLSFPGPGALLWVLVLLVPLAALFSALCLALATFARSTKEGQYYLTPLLMVVLGLTVFCLAPGTEIDLFYSVMPVVGPALLLKELLAAPGSTQPLVYALPVLVSSTGYSLLALWWAIDQFSREEVLFREAERFDVRLWVRHLLRDKEPVPSFAEAGFCFVVVMFLQFGAIRFLGGMVAPDSLAGDPDGASATMMRLLLVQQIALIASPALFMGLILTSSVRRTFLLTAPKPAHLIGAVLLALVLHPLTLELAAFLQQNFFRPLPAEFVRQIQAMADPNQSLGFVLLGFAVAPALCEELAFRGFVLSGFARSGRTGLAIGLSSLTFGIMHVIPQQVFNAALLGLVLGLIAVRSGSLFPGIAFHLVYNALAVLRARIPAATDAGPWDWFVRTTPEGLRYRWPLLILCGAAAFVLLQRLLKSRPVEEPGTVDEPAVGSASSPRIAEESRDESHSGRAAVGPRA